MPGRLLAATDALSVTAAAQLLLQNARPAAQERMAEATQQARVVEAHRQLSSTRTHRVRPRRGLGPSL